MIPSEYNWLKQRIPSEFLFGLGSICQGFEHQFSGRLDVLRRSHVAHWNVSGGPRRFSGTGSWSRDELHDAAEEEVAGIAFQHRVPNCLVCFVEEIQALLQFPAIRNRCTSSIISQRTW